MFSLASVLFLGLEGDAREAVPLQRRARVRPAAAARAALGQRARVRARRARRAALQRRERRALA